MTNRSPPRRRKPTTTAAEPKADGEKPADAVKKEADEEEDSNEVALSVDFEASISGYTFTIAKSKDTDESWVNVESHIERSGIVKTFSIFVSTLMWILTIGVLFLMMSVVLRGRKVELAMFLIHGNAVFRVLRGPRRVSRTSSRSVYLWTSHRSSG